MNSCQNETTAMVTTNDCEESETNSSQGWYQQNTLPQAVLIFGTSFEILIFLAIVFGNILVIVAFVKYHQIRDKNSNLFLLALAITDMMTAFLCIPFNIYKKYMVPLFWRHIPENILHSNSFCLMSTFLQVLPLLCGYAMLLVIAIDRFVSIRYPLRHVSIMTYKVCVRMIVGGFLFQTFSFGIILAFKEDGFNARTEVCIIENLFKTNNFKRVFAIAFLTYLPIIALFCLHAYVLISAVRQSAKVQSLELVHTVDQKREMKVTKGMLRIVFLFALCNLPNLISKTVPSKGDESWIIHSLKYFLIEMTFLNSALNPLIYAKHDKLFHRAFVKILCFWKEGQTHFNLAESTTSRVN